MKRKWNKNEWGEWPPRYFALADVENSKQRNEASFEYFREKYRDVLKWEHTEPEALIEMLGSLAAQGDTQGAQAIDRFAECSMKQLAALAKNDFARCQRFVRTLTSANHALFKLLEKNSEMQKLVQFADQWPALLYRHPQNRRHIEEFYLKQCGLGALSPVSNSFSFDTMETRIAFHLLQRINAERMTNPKIPFLTKENSRHWWKLAKPIFIVAFGNDFPRHSDFKKYWRKFETKVWKDRRLKEYEKRDVVRKDILKAMERAFRTLAKFIGGKATPQQSPVKRRRV